MSIKERIKKIDYTDPVDGSALIAAILTVIYFLFPEYSGMIIRVPTYVLIVLILVIFVVPALFLKYYFMPMKKLVPERELFIAARKQRFPVIQKWNSNGYFEFVRGDREEIEELNLPKSYTVKGLEIYQYLENDTNKNVYKEAFQNISSSMAVTDMQSFRQVIEILKSNKSSYMLKLIIISGVALFIILIGLGIFLKLKGDN